MRINIITSLISLIMIFASQCQVDEGSRVKSFSAKRTGIIGSIDGAVNRDGSFQIRGWACDEGVNEPISLHIYAGGLIGTGTAIRAHVTDQKTEANVKKICGTENVPNTKHRFNVTFTASQLRTVAGKSIYIYGLSKSGGTNKTLTRSGHYSFPGASSIGDSPSDYADSESPNVKGRIDSARIQEGEFVIRGWACDNTVNRPLTVHIFVGGPAGKGRVVGGFETDQLSGDAVNAACHTSDAKHRFAIKYPLSAAAQYAGQAIYIHGISLSSGENRLLSGSGELHVPTADVFANSQPNTVETPGVKGRIESARIEGDEVIIRGWACDNTVNSPISLHIFVGGAAGSGKLVGGFETDQISGDAVQAACHTADVNHRFAIKYPLSAAAQYAGQAIFIHGISSSSGANRLLSGSGELQVPTTEIPDNITPATSWSSFLQQNSGRDVTIPAGTNLLIDRNIDLGLLKISGQLLCPEIGNFEIKTEGILVTGPGSAFICGRDEAPFNGSLKIIFSGERNLNELGGSHPMGKKGFVAMNGGKIQLIATTQNQGWVKLGKTAAVSSATIQLDRPVLWRLGDSIVIASSTYNPHDAEKRKIIALSSDSKTITLDSPLVHAHWGQTENFSTSGRSWTLDERAEVINLTRKIRIMSEDDTSYRERRLGAHMMVMGSGKAYVNGVEFTRVGQGGKMGRYPFHWHRRGDVSGQYIKNSSIHQSMNRCITVHGTQFAEVSGNSCYDHYGHGFFLEDGNETKNKIINNIGLLSRKVSSQYALLVTDRTTIDPQRYAPPATFWIANPDNDIHGNVAAGSEGTGFWMGFQRYLACNSNGCSNKRSAAEANVFPLRTNTLRFSDNIAHSSFIGITHDGAPDAKTLVGNPLNPSDRNQSPAHYDPPVTPVFTNLVAYKNSRTGIYFRGGPAVYENAILADNGWSFFVAFAQVLKNSLIVALSQNHQNSEFDERYQNQTQILLFGAVQYDGPMALQNVHFANFSQAITFHRSWSVTSSPFGLIGAAQRYVNTGKGITFSPANLFRHFYQSTSGWDDAWASAFYDVDGSITGKARTYVVPAVAMNNHSSCSFNRSWNSYLCGYELGHIRFRRIKHADYINYSLSRSDGGSFTPPIGSTKNNKFAVILDPSITYTVSNIEMGDDLEAYIYFSARLVDALSPVIRLQFKDKSNCRFDGITAVQSLESLRGETKSAYYRSGNDVYVKFRATDERQFYAPESPKGIVSKKLICEF